MTTVVYIAPATDFNIWLIQKSTYNGWRYTVGGHIVVWLHGKQSTHGKVFTPPCDLLEGKFYITSKQLYIGNAKKGKGTVCCNNDGNPLKPVYVAAHDKHRDTKKYKPGHAIFNSINSLVVISVTAKRRITITRYTIGVDANVATLSVDVLFEGPYSKLPNNCECFRKAIDAATPKKNKKQQGGYLLQSNEE